MYRHISLVVHLLKLHIRHQKHRDWAYESSEVRVFSFKRIAWYTPETHEVIPNPVVPVQRIKVPHAGFRCFPY